MFWAPIIAAGISAAGSIASGLMSRSGASQQADTQYEIAMKNIEHQKEFAQHGIRWKAEDARMAGIHPAFAMGAQTNSFSPVSVGTVQDDSASHFARAGQDIGRAVQAGLTHQERDDQVMTRTAQALQLNRMGLENELLKSQIARNTQALNPPFPGLNQRSPGGGNTGDVVHNPQLGVYESKPHEIVTQNPQNPAIAAGPPVSQNVWAWSHDGKLQGFPSPQVIQDQEISNPLMARWMLTQGWRKPPKNLLPKGAYDWSWNADGWSPVFPDGGRAGSAIGGRISSSVTVPMPARGGRGAYIGRP